MRDSTMISTPDTPKFGQFLDAQTQYVRDLWVIRAWSAVWPALKYNTHLVHIYIHMPVKCLTPSSVILAQISFYVFWLLYRLVLI